MKKKFGVKALYALAMACLLAACAGGLPKTLDAGADEVIVVGRFHALEHGEEVTPDIQLVFNKPVTGFHRTLAPRDSGHFVMRLPRGHNWIARLEYRTNYTIFHGYKTGYVNLPKNPVVLDLPDSGKIHYVGDIRVVFSRDGMERGSGSLIDHLARDLKGPSDFLPVIFEVTLDSAAARAFVRRRYGIAGEWTQAPLEDREGPKIEREILEEGEEPE
jgi:hypothetical protein